MAYEKNTRILLITNKLEEKANGGRQMLSKLNFNILKIIYGENLILYELSNLKPNSIISKINAVNGHIDGINKIVISELVSLIKHKNITKVFVDGSNLGVVVKYIKIKLPKVLIAVFFHNVESKFFLDAFRKNISLQSLAVLIANFFAEKKSVKYSDKMICLNSRDSFMISKVYGRKTVDISEMSLVDTFPINYPKMIKKNNDDYVLFVGGDFYANREGILWFIKNVAHNINIKTVVVGRGFEKFKDQFKHESNIKIIGSVDDLSEWYINAKFIIAPIFDGSGMKTKVAEALMFGKRIIGTPEAFAGYEEFIKQAGKVCITADEFIEAIKLECLKDSKPFYQELRNIYLENFSFNASALRLKNILCD